MCLIAELPKVRNESEKANILNKMFSIVVQLLDSTFEKRDLGNDIVSLSYVLAL